MNPNKTEIDFRVAKKGDFYLDKTNGGVLLIDKYSGWTSFDAVNKIRRLLKIKKVGHAGTLDPAATGLLIIAYGKKTKALNQLQNFDKEYAGTIELGKTTPSMDGETEPTLVRPFENVTEDAIYSVRDKILKSEEQIPPMYSALKQNGKALYKLARKGKEVKREPRKIKIYEFEITRIDLPEVDFRLRVSKGTYVRVIANDFGEALGCGGYLKKLRRTAIGDFRVEEAFTIDEFSEELKKYESLL